MATTENGRLDDPNKDLGFGSVVSAQRELRLLNRDGSFNVRRTGLSFIDSLNPYHSLLTMTWPVFLALVTVAYLLVNLFFALLYLACGPGALHVPDAMRPDGALATSFFFSVETFATIGYGNISPMSISAHAVMVVESLVGILAVALATGIIFARFSRPTARIRFSRSALIAPYRDMRAFEFRIANERRSELIEVECKLLFVRRETTNGRVTRAYHPLTLERSRVTFFPLSWTVVHPIDDSSPLLGQTPESLHESEAEFLVLLTGVDDASENTVHARTSYRSEEIAWDARFSSVFNAPPDGGALSIDIGRLHDIDHTR